MRDNSDKMILVIDDDEGILSLFKRFLEGDGFRVHTETRAEPALRFLEKNHADLITVDVKMPEMDGIEFIKAAKKMKCPAEIIVISGTGSLGAAVEAIKLGAFDYIEKPVGLEKLRVTVQNALQKSRLQDKVSYFENRTKSRWTLDDIIGNSEEMTKAKKTAKKVAGADINVLITGETGTGKEVFAQAIHNAGARGGGPFVAINCGAISENLLESEMFGHEKGAFTGAVSRRIGHFEHAAGGTIFLDEVSEMPMPLQVKLLRVIQEKEFMRIGSTKPIHTDCRVISATNRDIVKEVEKGSFREDLYYRLNVISLKIPPLRDRAADIPLLIDHLLKKYSVNDIAVDAEVMEIFKSHSWPGNIRELDNIIHRAIALSSERIITLDLLPEGFLEMKNLKSFIEAPSTYNLHKAQEIVLDAFNRRFVEKALRRNKGNVTVAAEQMGLSRQSLHKMMKKCGVSSGEFKP